MSPEIANPHTKKPFDLYDKLQVIPESGLASIGIPQRQNIYGKNQLPEQNPVNPFNIFARQFQSILIYILFAAAAISAVTGHPVDSYVILAVIVINAFIGFFQEYRAEKSVQALQALVVHKARVVRDGKLQEIPQTELTVGDIIRIEEGDYIPADARIIESFALKTMEASLTGESGSIEKHEEVLPEDAALGDRKNMIWMGTYANSGSAMAIVTGVGVHTQIGSIAQSLAVNVPENLHYRELTEKLVRIVGGITIGLAVVIFVYGYFIQKQEIFDIFLFSLATLVSGIPEGLPAVLAIVLAIGAQRMARHKAVIRSLPTIETIGAVTTICTDKTGTLTENIMQVKHYWSGEGVSYQVKGSGWSSKGEILRLGSGKLSFPESVVGLIGDKSHSTHLSKEEDVIKVVGEPTEAALKVFAQKLKKQAGYNYDDYEVVAELPFNSDYKFRGTVVLYKPREEYYLLSIGAPEVLLERVTKQGSVVETDINDGFIESCKRHIHKQNQKGFRTIGLAIKKVAFTPELNKPKPEHFQGLTFIGITSIQDPLRQEVKIAIAEAQRAGIRVVMMTGDHRETARAIAIEAGLISEAAGERGVLSEVDLQNLSEEEFVETIKNVNVFARLTPQTKLHITESFQEQGHIVAMTGDGVNDAPALKRADVGIAMGINGTDVSREASDMILTDDNFVSIVTAVAEGRTVFENIQRSSYYLLSTNFGESLTILLALFLGFPAPLTATQILWINLVTDSINGIALATERSHDEMTKPPRPLHASILTWQVVPYIAIISGLMVLIGLTAFPYFYPGDIRLARTAVYAAIVLPQLFNLFSLRNLYGTTLNRDFFGNMAVNLAFVASLSVFLLAIYLPGLRDILGFSPLPLYVLGIMIVVSSSGLWMVEFYKYIKGHLNHKHEHVHAD
jgi:Ca2+-transporting ATPase